MGIEVCTIGGYKEVGRNCIAVKVDDEVVILDMGLHMENYVRYTEEEDIRNITAKQLVKVAAIPDISHINDWIDNVIAIVPSHAHLDHIGAIPFISKNFNAPIIATPFTIEVLKRICRDEHISLKNKIIRINPNSSRKLSKNITVEFIHATHSTPQSSMVALHTPYGVVLYASDFKFDNQPTLGPKPNYARLQELKGKVLLLITECLYAELHQKMPSESVAREMLKDVMLHTDTKGKALIVTTFSSHIARLKSIIEFGKKTNRKLVFLGRSLDKYISSAEKVGLVNFTKDIGQVLYGKRAEKMLSTMSKNKGRYLIVMTGHQGEPKAILSRIADNQYKFNFETGDSIVFSCRIIPSPTTIANRKAMDAKLKEKGVRLFTDIHVSGHAAREDLRELLLMVEPKHIIPTHGEPHMLAALAELATEINYKPEQVHILFNAQRLKLG